MLDRLDEAVAFYQRAEGPKTAATPDFSTPRRSELAS